MQGRSTSIEKRGAYFERYRQLMIVGSKAESTLMSEYQSHTKFWRFLDQVGHKGDELSITKYHISEYVLNLKESGASNNYQIKLLANLSSFYKQAVRQEWVLINPMSGIELPKKLEEVPTILTVKEMKLLLSAPDLNRVDGFRDRVMMELAYGCGLRRHEVVGLCISQLYDGCMQLKVQGKGGKEAMIPITRMAAYYLKFYLEEIYIKLNRDQHPQLFLSVQTRKPLSPGHMNDIVKRYVKKSCIDKKVSSHVFRHSIATHLGESGVDVRFIQEFLRHNSLDATMRYIQQGFRQLQEVHRRTHPSGGGETNG